MIGEFPSDNGHNVKAAANAGDSGSELKLGPDSPPPVPLRPADPTLVRRTVQAFPTADGAGSSGVFTIFMATAADEIIPWGQRVKARDKQLRAFWPTEPILAGAIYGVCARNAAFGWKIDEVEPAPKTSKAVTRMLKSANLGRGWTNFMIKGSQDLLAQDNGWFFELIRVQHKSDSPVIGLNQLDSGQCTRTGNPEIPVIYTDRNGEDHKLRWFDVISIEDLPSPIESMNGVQYCAVTRVLKAAQVIRDLSTYKREKISGRFTRAIHLVGGVSNSTVLTAIQTAQENANNDGLLKYIQPIIIAGLDPNAPVTHELLEMATLPDGFDEDITLKWYIAQIANGFGGDYQDFAPLPSGNLGTSQQSQVLDQKSKERGPALFMNTVSDAFNYQGVIPQIVEFIFDDQDPAASEAAARLRHQRAATRALRIQSTEISVGVARKIAIKDGDLLDSYVSELEKVDADRAAEAQKLAQQAAAAKPPVRDAGTASKTPRPNSPPTTQPRPPAKPASKSGLSSVSEVGPAKGSGENPTSTPTLDGQELTESVVSPEQGEPGHPSGLGGIGS